MTSWRSKTTANQNVGVAQPESISSNLAYRFLSQKAAHFPSLGNRSHDPITWFNHMIQSHDPITWSNHRWMSTWYGCMHCDTVEWVSSYNSRYSLLDWVATLTLCKLLHWVHIMVGTLGIIPGLGSKPPCMASHSEIHHNTSTASASAPTLRIHHKCVGLGSPCNFKVNTFGRWALYPLFDEFWWLMRAKKVSVRFGHLG